MPHDPYDLTAHLAAYTPGDIDAELWAATRALVNQCVTLARPDNVGYTGKLLTPVAGLAGWAHQQGRRYTTPAQLLTPANIEGFTAHLTAGGTTERTTATHRARLRQLSKKVNAHLWPTTGAPVARAHISDPYTAEEVERMLAHINGLDGKRRRVAAALLYVGLGAGAAGGDLRDLRARHIGQRDGLVIIELSGIPRTRQPRTVPVLHRYAQPLAELAAALPPDELLLGGQVLSRRNITEYATRQFTNYGGPAVNAGRLRSTWLLTLLDAQVPLNAILAGAGIRSANAVVDLLAHSRHRPDQPDTAQLLAYAGQQASR